MKDYPLLQKIGKTLLAAAGRIVAFARKAEDVPGKIPEIMILLLYAAAHLSMAMVHEPFFDEAEAWQIARCVSLRTLFLETTHYEGHPPLWHLILMPLAKAGAPYELSLTLVSLLFVGTAVFLILWYAPFPRLVRLLLPFTYFFFYQYGVISRVYCVMVLAFVLLAMAYGRRNEKPGRYVSALVFLCVTMAYGLVIAGGLALVWLWEIVNEGRHRQDRHSGEDERGCGKRKGRNGQNDQGMAGSLIRKRLKGYVTDRRIRWLAVLLAAAIGVLWMIMPRTDTYAMASAASETVETPFAVRLLYTFFVLPSDVLLTDIYSEHLRLSQAYLMPSAMFSGVLIGILIWSILLYYGRKRGTALLLLLPYGLFAVFAAAVYVSIHHIGIGLLYFCFWCWVTAERAQSSADISMAGAVRCTAILLGTLAMFVSLYWTAAACRLDIERTYAPGRNEAAFIREHGLDGYRMMTGWQIMHDDEGNLRLTDINQCSMSVNLAPYFEHNLFFNFNGGKDERNYITHIHPSEEETQRQYEIWAKEEPPAVLWMMPEIAVVYDGTTTMRDYEHVYQGDIWQIWKSGADYYVSDIHVRRDLLEKTGLQPLR